MAFLDRVAGTTTGTGTGNLTVSTLLGFVSPCSAFASGTTGVPLCIVDSTTGAYELSSCTVVDSTTISRDSVISSSNSNALVNFAAGTKNVFHDVPASVINDLLANRPAAATVITSGVIVADDYLPIVQGGAVKRILIEDFLASIGESSVELPLAGALSGSDVLSVTQDGVNEVQTTLSAIASYVAAILSGSVTATITATTANSTTSMSATGYVATSSATIAATTDDVSVSASATGSTSSGTATISATTDDVTTSMSASVGASYTIAGYSGNAVNSTINAASLTVYGSLKHVPVTPQFTDSFGYFTISPTPASSRSGWGTSNSTPPAEITQAANTAAGSSINGMTPMNHPGAWQSMANLWVTNGSGTSTWYFWIKPVDGVAQCMTPSGVTVNNA